MSTIALVFTTTAIRDGRRVRCDVRKNHTTKNDTLRLALPYVCMYCLYIPYHNDGLLFARVRYVCRALWLIKERNSSTSRYQPHTERYFLVETILTPFYPPERPHRAPSTKYLHVATDIAYYWYNTSIDYQRKGFVSAKLEAKCEGST